MGNTLYNICSLQSEVYFCIYEKGLRAVPRKWYSIEDAETVLRFDWKMSVPYYAVRDLLSMTIQSIPP